MAKVYVVGIDGSGVLAERARDALAQSRTILASERLRDVFTGYREYPAVSEKVQVINAVDDTIGFIRGARSSVSVIASGDPMFFGIGARITEALPEADVEIYPALSSVQLAFAKIRLPWHDAFFMSLHGRIKRQWSVDDVPLLAETRGKLVILTGGDNTPEKIARVLPEKARVYVLEKLGFQDEAVKEGSPEEISRMTFRTPNLMVVVCEPRGVAFGLEEFEFLHERGLFTKDEVRAVALHKLRLPVKGVLWDVGAGSGAVSIEAKRLCPSVEVYAVEKDAAKVEHIRENAVSLRAGKINIVRGEAPSALEGLPAPDRVFIGGAGRGLPSVIEYVSRRMDRGIIVVSVITLESLSEAREALRAQGLRPQVSSISVSRSQPLDGREYMKALNQIFLVRAEK